MSDQTLECKISRSEREIRELEQKIAGHEQAIANRKKELESKRRILERAKAKHAAMAAQLALRGQPPQVQAQGGEMSEEPKICGNCLNRGKESSYGYYCLFYESDMLFYYEGMVVECKGWEQKPAQELQEGEDA